MSGLAGAVATFVFFAGSFSAYSQPSPILGVGDARCQVLLSGNLFQPDAPSMQWLLGYISGAAAYSESVAIRKNSTSRLASRSINWTSRI